MLTSMWLKHGIEEFDTDSIVLRLTRTIKSQDSVEDSFREFPEHSYSDRLTAYEDEYCPQGKSDTQF